MSYRESLSSHHSKDPEKAAAQLRNLHGSRPPEHGLRSPSTMLPYFQAAADETVALYPWLTGSRLEQRVHLKGLLLREDEWVRDRKDVIFTDKKTGEDRFHGVVRDAVSWRRDLTKLDAELIAEQAEREREADTPSLADVIAEIEANRETDDAAP